MFWTRLLSGIVLLVLLVLFGIWGGVPLLLLTAFIALVGLFELYRSFGIEKKLLGFAGFVGAVALYGAFAFSFDISIVLVLTILCILCIYVIRYPHYKAAQVAEAIFGFFYVPVFLSFIVQTRALPGGKYLIWLIFLSSWGSDTCAYCVGRLLGKHKMTPLLSPKKTVEGAIGGALGAVLLTLLIYGVFLRGTLSLTWMAVFQMMLATGFGAILSMIGDLCASAIKREYDIKDFGKLIPGHGGIMDRFDSVIFTAPAVYYVLRVFV